MLGTPQQLEADLHSDSECESRSASDSDSEYNFRQLPKSRPPPRGAPRGAPPPRGAPRGAPPPPRAAPSRVGRAAPPRAASPADSKIKDHQMEMATWEARQREAEAEARKQSDSRFYPEVLRKSTSEDPRVIMVAFYDKYKAGSKDVDKDIEKYMNEGKENWKDLMYHDTKRVFHINPCDFYNIKTKKENLEEEYEKIENDFKIRYEQRGGDPNESGTGSAVEGVGEASIGVLSTAEGTLASTMGIYKAFANKLKESIESSTGGKKPKRATKIKCIKNKRIRKLYKGPRGGTYYKSKGRKIYVR